MRKVLIIVLLTSALLSGCSDPSSGKAEFKSSTRSEVYYTVCLNGVLYYKAYGTYSAVMAVAMNPNGTVMLCDDADAIITESSPSVSSNTGYIHPSIATLTPESN